MPPRRSRTLQKKGAQGFTLIELIVVIAIIAIIIVGIFVALRPADRIDDAQTARDESTADQIDNAIQVYMADTGNPLPIPTNTPSNPDICKYNYNPANGECVNLDFLKNQGYLPSIPESAGAQGNITGFKLKYAANDYDGVAVTPRSSSSSSSSTSAGGGGGGSSAPTSSLSSVSSASSSSSVGVGGGGGSSSSAAVSSVASSLSSASSAVSSASSVASSVGVSSSVSSSLSSSFSSFGPLALNFTDTSNTTISVPHDAAYSFSDTSQFSVSLWIKPTVSGTWKPIISKNDGVQNGFEISLLSLNRIQFYAFSNNIANALAVTSTLDVPLNAYSHVVVTYDGQQAAEANRVSIYLNGVKDSSAEVVEQGVLGSFANTSPLQFGQGFAFCFQGPCNHIFGGRVDEAKIYARVLNQSDVNALFSTAVADPSGQVAYWPFDQGGPGSAVLVGAPQFGALTNFNTATDWVSDPFVQPAPVETSQYALKFTQANGTMVEVPNNPAFAMSHTDDFSISVWMKRASPFPGAILENVQGPPAHGAMMFETSSSVGWAFSDNPSAGVIDAVMWTISTSLVPIGQYTHIVFTYDKDIADPAARMKWYVNGASVPVQYATTGTFPANTSASGDLQIGGQDMLFVQEYFDGNLDELKFFRRTLNATEAMKLATPMFADPIEDVRWSFDQGGPGSSVLFSFPALHFGQLQNFNTATDWVTDDAY